MYSNSLIKIIEDEVEKTENNIKSKLSNNKSLIKINIDLEEYILLENKLIYYIKSLNSSKDKQNYNIPPEILQNHYIYKQKNSLRTLRIILYNKFTNNDENRLKYIYEIDLILYKIILPDFNCDDSILNLSKNCTLEEKQSISFFENISKIELSKAKNLLILELNKKLSLNNIKINILPEFILYEMQKLLRRMIFTKWSLNFKILLKDRKLSDKDDPDFRFIYQIFREFYDDKITLFDMKYLSKNQDENNKLKVLLFNALFLANANIMSSSSNQKIFFNNVTRYLNLLGFDRTKCRYSQIITNCMNNANEENKDKTFKEIINILLNDKSGKKFMFIIWCLSMIMNNIVIFDEKENKINFSPYLKCSARGKIFFYNFLNTLDNYIIFNNCANYFNNTSVRYNAQIENFVFAELTKSYTKVLYDEQNKHKINLTIKKIFILLEKLNKNKKEGINLILKNLTNDEDDDENEEDLYEGFECSALDEIEAADLYEYYYEFVMNYIKFEKNNKITENNIKNIDNNKNENNHKGHIFGNLFSKNHKKNDNNNNKNDYNTNNINDQNNINKIIFNNNEELLIPIDILNTATQIMICISGGEKPNDENSKSDIFKYILSDSGIENIDYYIYNWKEKSSFENINNTALIYGKLLAYIIASREIFRFQSISFVTIGDGCKVLKSCLNELSTKVYQKIDITDLIQDVILIDPTIKLDLTNEENLLCFKLVAGKIVNVFKQKEFVINVPENRISSLRVTYSIIGGVPITNDMNNKEGNMYHLPQIYNFDLINEFKFNNENYIIEINKIFRKIKESIKHY